MKLAMIMDPIATVKTYKDTSFRLLLEAQERGYECYYLEMSDLSLIAGKPMAHARRVDVVDQERDFYKLGESVNQPLADFDVIMMRKDPPFDTEFLYTTYLLELAEEAGALVVNKPRSLRDCNEKLFTAWFSHLTPPTIVTRRADEVRAFHKEHQDIILKPLDGMGGASIFRVGEDGNNLGVIIETLTAHGQRFAMIQRYMPEIKDGDKRILIIDGEPMPYSLARVPSAGETRGNLAAGGSGRPQPLSDSDWELAREVGPELKRRGLLLVGLDVIGDRITEINVTSPTCMREIEAAYDINIAGKLYEAIEARREAKSR
ncbi:glutathione synthase [Pseudidiomarina terrestris]|uniref:Glutathione synthetase n=1 Tax=Pseudidiomarina terrestris TaxID=2820060 RepID=A0ABT8MJ66_9GAMM|nr:MULTISPECIES: glutathione synthase [unclassified Pseudidiomarina]MDN7129997.1 glutathione synthase [Pseudidiomarina sp. 1APR75-15]MDN7136149.1 glutathione synthase [Pseudidiomarina sp. 1ASP75-5]MDN7138325.1 glutathione synthase [Pseudidiomarina sp. 1ASP75-14]MEA3588912.1 glutathione synthase [Pseudidiomarina sp. 1APP75-27a]